MRFLRRYLFPAGVAAYAAALALFHAAGWFPRPGLQDLSWLIGSPSVVVTGRVLDMPATRWNRTRFLLEGCAEPLSGFHGRVMVTLPMACRDLLPGETLRVRGWLRPLKKPVRREAFDEAGYWAGRGTFAALQVWRPENVQRLVPPAIWLRWTGRFHLQFRAFWFDHLPPAEAALMNAIALGNHGVLAPEAKRACIRAGVYHILVVSGQKIALLVVMVFALLRFLGVRGRWLVWIVAPLLVFYAQVVGAEPPVVRATIMALVALGLRALGRDTPAVYGFAWAAFWILLREPEALFGASFQLSFVAAGGLLFLMPLAQRFLKVRGRAARWAAEAGLVSAAAYIAAGPLLVYYFHQLSLAGLIANWTLFPLSGGLLIAGLACGVWGVWQSGSVPQPVLQTMRGLLQGLWAGIHALSGSRWAAFSLPPPTVMTLTVYYVVLICVLVKVNGIRR